MRTPPTVLAMLVLILCAPCAWGSDTAIEVKALSDEELDAFKVKLGTSAAQYFDTERGRYGLYLADVNNDGTQDYLLTNEDGGRLQVDSIIEAFSIENGEYVPLDIDRVMPDGSEMPFYFGQPFIIVERGKTYLNFFDGSEEIQYLWEGNSFGVDGYRTLGYKKWLTPEGPSFDCNLAKTEDEKVICSDTELSKLDRKMAELYNVNNNMLLVSGMDRKQFLVGQKNWLHARNGVCGTSRSSSQKLENAAMKIACFKKFYSERIGELERQKLDLEVLCNKSFPDHLEQESKYSTAGFYDQPAFENFYKEFSAAVANGDKVRAASLISFPIRINTKGKFEWIPDILEFIKRWDNLFVENGLKPPSPNGLSDSIIRSDGVGVDLGTYWFSPGNNEKPMLTINR